MFFLFCFFNVHTKLVKLKQQSEIIQPVSEKDSPAPVLYTETETEACELILF